MLRTLVAGIMSNVPALLMQHLTEIIEVLAKAIEVNHRSVLNELTSKLPFNGSTAPPVEVIDEEMNDETDADASLRRLKDEMPTAIEQEVKFVGYLLSAQRMSAEILSNICTPDDEETNEDIDDRSDAESVHDYEVGQQQNGNHIAEDKIPVEVSEAINAHQVVEKVNLS